MTSSTQAWLGKPAWVENLSHYSLSCANFFADLVFLVDFFKHFYRRVHNSRLQSGPFISVGPSALVGCIKKLRALYELQLLDTFQSVWKQFDLQKLYQKKVTVTKVEKIPKAIFFHAQLYLTKVFPRDQNPVILVTLVCSITPTGY